MLPVIVVDEIHLCDKGLSAAVAYLGLKIHQKRKE